MVCGSRGKRTAKRRGLSKGKIAVLEVISRKRRRRGVWIERCYFSEGWCGIKYIGEISHEFLCCGKKYYRMV